MFEKLELKGRKVTVIEESKLYCEQASSETKLTLILFETAEIRVASVLSQEQIPSTKLVDQIQINFVRN